MKRTSKEKSKEKSKETIESVSKSRGLSKSKALSKSRDVGEGESMGRGERELETAPKSVPERTSKETGKRGETAPKRGEITKTTPKRGETTKTAPKRGKTIAKTTEGTTVKRGGTTEETTPKKSVTKKSVTKKSMTKKSVEEEETSRVTQETPVNTRKRRGTMKEFNTIEERLKEGYTLEEIREEYPEFCTQVKDAIGRIERSIRSREKTENQERINKRKRMSKSLTRIDHIHQNDCFHVEEFEGKILISDKTAINFPTCNSHQQVRDNEHVILLLDHADHFGIYHSPCEREMLFRMESAQEHTNTVQIRVKCEYCNTGWMQWRRTTPNHSLL